VPALVQSAEKFQEFELLNWIDASETPVGGILTVIDGSGNSVVVSSGAVANISVDNESVLVASTKSVATCTPCESDPAY